MENDVVRCSAPGCVDEAKYEVVTRNAGSHTGKTFYTCEKHSQSTDFRRPVGDT